MKQPIFYRLPALFFLIALGWGFSFITCSSSTDWANEASGDSDIPAYQIQSTNSSTWSYRVTQTMTTNGSTMSGTAGSSEQYDFSITFSSGALNEDETISVSFEDITDDDLPKDFKIVSPLIVLEREEAGKLFAAPVFVTLTYDEALVKYGDGILAYYYDPEKGQLEAVTTTEVDTTGHTVTFATRHFSKFLLIEYQKRFEDLASLMIEVMTGFNNGLNGWFIPNYGSLINPTGNCVGMASYAKWFFSFVLSGKLYSKYIEGRSDYWQDDATAIELATRAQLAESVIWSESDKTMWTRGMTSRKTALSFLGALQLTNTPQILYVDQVFNNNTAGGAHAVLVTGYRNGEFSIYDPNYPNSTRYVQYTFGTGWGIYSSGTTAGSGTFQYNRFGHFGNSLLHDFAAMWGLYEAADDFSNNSIFPKIEVTSHKEGETVKTKVITLAGTVTGGQQQPSSVLIFVNGKKLQTPISSGAFSKDIPLEVGENSIVFLATDTDEVSRWAGYKEMKIVGDFRRADMLVTLTWDKDLTDIDLYVTDPEGETVYFSQQGPSRIGGELDMDDVDGFGPEHYTLTPDTDDTMPAGDYVVRVHYYADHDADTESTQPVNWTVKIKYAAYIDPETEQPIYIETAYTGTLSVDNSANDDPGSSGPDWDDVATITISEPDPDDFLIEPLADK